jgi:BMFP domain-containing protein YqiC
MTPLHVFDELANRAAKLLAESPAKDVEKNLRASLAGLFSRLDLVTREEFDVQAALLEKARARLTELEQRLSELEKPPPA